MLASVAIALCAILLLILVAAAWMTLRDTRGRTRGWVRHPDRDQAGERHRGDRTRASVRGRHRQRDDISCRVRARPMRTVELKPGVYDFTTGMTDASVLDALERRAAGGVRERHDPRRLRDRPDRRALRQAGRDPRGGVRRAGQDGRRAVRRGPSLSRRAPTRARSRATCSPRPTGSRRVRPAREVIEMMLDQFDKEIAHVDVAQPTQRGLTLNQVVTLASMIERESKLDSETAAGLVGHLQPAEDRLVPQDRCDDPVRSGEQPVPADQPDTQARSPYNTYLTRVFRQGRSRTRDSSRFRPRPHPPRRSSSTMC